MLSELPEEIIINIFKQLESSNSEIIEYNKMDILFIIRLKEVNQSIKKIINNFRDSWKYIPYKQYVYPNNEVTFTINQNLDLFNKRTNKINILCQKKTSVDTFRWLMDNNIHFSLKNISELIIHNRSDVILAGFHYKDFLNIMFNRFYVFTDEKNNLNPIIVAAVNNRVNIIKILIKYSSIGNPFIEAIPKLLDISIKYNHRNLLNYLVVDHYDRISDILNSKIGAIINRIDNCEDVVFYLLINKKIIVNHNLLMGCISKNYLNLFIYSYNDIIDPRSIKKIELVKSCIDKNNYDIFNYLLCENRCLISNCFLTDNILKKKLSSETIEKHNIFMINIINNHLDKIKKDSNLIERCIDLNIKSDYITKLVISGFKYTDKEIYTILNNKNIELLRVMVSNFKEDMFTS